MTQVQKLYVVVRADISPGRMIAQAVHGYKEFSIQHPEVDTDWYENSNQKVILQVKNESELKKLITKAEEKGIKYSLFREPDLDNTITCITMEPGIDTKFIVRKLSLALS